MAATSYPGVIYTSTDAGATWVSNHVFAQAWGAVASSADGNKLVAAAQNDTIYGCALTAPVIYNPPTSRTVVAGTRVTFSMGASGAVPLAYQWQLNGADLASETNAVLGLPNVPMAASGRRYVVRVSNTLGSVLSTEAVLTVVPAFVSTEPPGGLTPTGVVFKGSVTPGAGLTAAWFQWGTDTNYDAATTPMNPGVSFDALSFTNSITGLSPAIVYHYRAVASNELGTVLGADVSFLTPGLPFTQSSAPLKNWLSVASSADGRKLAAVATFGSGGLPGQIFTSTNSGATWTLTDAPTEGWNFVASSADGSRLAALPGGVDLECWGSGGGGYGPIYISTNSGATWAASSSSLMRWTGAAASADGMKWVAVASDWSRSAPGLIYISTNGGATWLPTSAPTEHWSSVASSADGTKLVATSKYFGQGSIYVSSDAGSHWTNVSVPSTTWTSVAASADGIKLVAVSASGLVYRSVDGGSGWASSGDAPFACWRSVTSSADGSKLAIAPADSTIFTSTNSGASWVPRAPSNDFNLTSIASSADGNKLLVSAYGGGIYTWQSTPEPWLNISSTGSDFVLSWLIPAMPLVLQENTELTTANWADVMSPPALNLTNLQNQVTVLRPVGHRFYRLKH